ncbi:IclR family transcriptional regulator [Fusobacterium sp. IOR10]|uniref:IclR family transcriptional regulator n=1 Tax=Fusobacterium sp. IOR10 TaxID=2665157 RepID=UPI0013D68429|nr:IclR family transcriptional regulator C-terminal domain-containing protein [Fusobacterium sp. IOR10]
MENLKNKTLEKNVPAIEKADKIFTYLYHNEKANQVTISRELNLSKATVNRLLFVLVKLEYLNLNNSFYSLGNKFSIFSNKNNKYNIIMNITYPYLEELSLKFKETFKLSVLDENIVRCIASVESSDYIKVPVSNKAIFPLHAGAASKLLISQLSDNKLNNLLEKNLPKYTENTITDRETLKKELLKINFKKIAFDNMEHSEKIKAIATPILNENNQIIAAISCPCFPEDLTTEKIEIISKSMCYICDEISKKLKYF